MRTNLSSQISLNRVSPKYYKPENAVERSVLTRCEKVPTDIYETMEEGVQHIANEITAKIQERQREGKFCVIGAGTGASLRPLYAELVRKHKDEGLSFRNVVIFNLYEYYPLASEGAGSSFSQLNDLFLSQIDIDKQNVFTIDGTIPQEAVIEYCRLYEQRIQTFGVQLDRVRAGFLCGVDNFNRTVVVLQMVRRHFRNDKDRGVCSDSAPAQINFLIHIVILSPSFSDI